MAGQDQSAFLFLNREGRWAGFHWEGLDLDAGGTLRLGALPAAAQVIELAPGEGTAEGPAGLAVLPDGTVVYSAPAGDRLYRVGGCDGRVEPAPCLGRGGGVGNLRAPRGLWWSGRRRALLVADSGNRRVVLVDPGSSRFLEVWGPERGLDAPFALAGDGRGAAYVVDRGARRLVKLDLLGRTVASFWHNAASAVQDPVEVAVSDEAAEARVFVLDAARRAVVVLDGDGRPLVDASGAPLAFGADVLEEPMGLAAAAAAVYVGDRRLQRVLQFVPGPAGWALAGEAVGYHGPVAALALDGRGHLLVVPGGSAPPLPLTLGAGRRSRGVLWSDAIQARSLPVHWRRLQLLPGALPAQAHLQLFVCTGDHPGAAPAAPDLTAPDPFPDARWSPMPPDACDVFVGGRAAGWLWVGALLSGDGAATPEVAQLRVDFDQESYLPFLPAVYRQHPQRDHFLARWLSLFESFFDEAEAETASLPTLLDPRAAPELFLRWLASWLAIPWDERWDEARQRRVIAEAFARSGWRGTAAGLRAALKELAGVDARVEEPLQEMAWWSLPASDAGEAPVGGAGSVLGVTTMLASAQPQGAVLGTSAVLDRSHLIDGDALGLPLFDDVAHRFTVVLQRGQVASEEALARVRAVVEAEKPAHVGYELCVIEPTLRVGFQARVGVDTVVAGRAPALRLGAAAPAGRAAALGGSPGGRVGETRVGESTRAG